MDSQWYVYKNLQVDGPFTWDQLVEMVNSGVIDAADLVWHNTGLEWKEAAQIPGLVYRNWPPTSDYSAPVQANKTLLSSLTSSRIALIMAVIFLFSLSATSLFLYFNRDSNDPEEQPRVDFSYNTVFEENEAAPEQGPDQEDLDLNNNGNEEKPVKTEKDATDANGQESPQADTTNAASPGSDAINDCHEAAEEPGFIEGENISWAGGKYTGPLLNEEPHGQGRWRHPDGRNYIGDFKYGEITGYGTMTFAGGEKYVGSFLRGKAHGDGTMTHPGGKKYSGEFRHGIIEGYGIMTFAGGEKYTGFFKNGVGHGKGTMTHPDGRSVSGTWTNGILTDKD